MTDLKMDEVPQDTEGETKAMLLDSFRVPVRFAGQEMFVTLHPGQSIETIRKIIATDHGMVFEELIIVRDGHDGTLDDCQPIDEHYPHHHRHHVHHKSAVEVTVYYQTQAKSHRFPRRATIEDVLDWAIDIFKIDAALASEFELARKGSQEELPGSEHIGHLAGHCETLELSLVRGDIANGGCHD